MKTLTILTILTILASSCEVFEFNTENPDVEVFVEKLIHGKYDIYEVGEDGENLWLIMPNFTERHIKGLLSFASDTSHLEAFPCNPISSRTPLPEGRDYFILSECLLWTIEGIRNGRGYGSLDPYLINTSLPDNEKYKGLSGSEILEVRDLYLDWWEKYEDDDWEDMDPLEGTVYRWF